MAIELLTDDEPRGPKHGEPRSDGLNLVIIDGEHKYWQKDNGTRVCGAKTRDFNPPNRFKRCRQDKIDSDTKRCRQHGGMSDRGAASHSFKTGEYSEYMPHALGERLENFMNDPTISSLREDLALADTRLSMKLEEIEGMETGQRWEELEERAAELDVALRNDDPATANQALREIQRIIQEGAEEKEHWDEIFDIMEQKRKLAETENKRIKASSNTLTPEEASMLIDVMVQLMKDVVEEHDVPKEALKDFNRKTRNLLDT